MGLSHGITLEAPPAIAESHFTLRDGTIPCSFLLPPPRRALSSDPLIDSEGDSTSGSYILALWAQIEIIRCDTTGRMTSRGRGTLAGNGWRGIAA